MRRLPQVLFISGLALAVGSWPCRAQDAPAAGKSFATDVKPLLEKYCWDCHGDGMDKGEVNFDAFTDEASVLGARKLWAGAQFHIAQWTMPPAKKEQPTPAEREFLTHYLDDLLNPVDPANPDPGRVTIRRLNRVEYNNTVRDLLGVTTRPADDFPEDDTGYGFDNIGDVLALSPLLMERYLLAADRVLNEAIPPGPPPSVTVTRGPRDLHGAGFPQDSDRLLAFSAETETDFTIATPGEYMVRTRVWQDAAGDEPARVELKIGENPPVKSTVKADKRDEAQTVETRLFLIEGTHAVRVAFTNDFYNADEPNPDKRDRNLHVAAVELEGPLKTEPKPLNETMTRLFAAPAGGEAEDETGARAVLGRFAARSFRRGPESTETDRLTRIYKAVRQQGEDHRGAMRVAMKAALVSPHFLYRIERARDPKDTAARVTDIDEFSLASRLSYWLWSSMPDDELLSLAYRGELRANLPAQVRRLLQDAKARALPENFAGQWLELRTLNVAAPDKDRFPDYSPELRDAMRRETEELFAAIVRENKPVTEILGASYTFLNARLAAFYGIPGVNGDEFRRVDLPPDSHRRGVLTHAAVLTVTSDPTRTSPVKRGKWVLENMLGITPPPPPPNVPALEEDAHAELTGSVRQRLEQHRSKPGCASCHALIDPIGFGLEGFNAIGQWRDKDGNFPVDSSGVLTTGQSFQSAAELAQVLLTDRRDTFLRALTGKMLTYALGRGVEPSDRPALDQILARMKTDGDTFESLIFGIIDSVPFQKRRGPAYPEAK